MIIHHHSHNDRHDVYDVVANAVNNAYHSHDDSHDVYDDVNDISYPINDRHTNYGIVGLAVNRYNDIQLKILIL